MESKKHILIVDDDVELASLLAQAISDVPEKYEVRTAKDVDGAMVQVHRAQTAQQPYDLVITDIKMLGLNGLELLEALKSIAPETKTITMTAYNSPELAERAHELNVYAYLTKPFVLSEFRHIVHSALYPDTTSITESESGTSFQLAPPQRRAISRQLGTLCSMTGSDIVALLHRDGDILAIETAHNQVPLDGICASLASAQRSIDEQLQSAFGDSSPIRQSYFGTETHNICTYRIDDEHFVAVFFGPAIKEGQVWYYLRDAVDRIRAALEQGVPQRTAQPRDQTSDIMDMIDQYFPPRQAQTKAFSLKPQAKARQRPKSPPEVPVQSEQEHVPQPENWASLAEIDWDATTDKNWDEIAATTEQGFGGLSYQQAQDQGLVNADATQGSEAAGPSEPALPPGAPSIDEIDWNAKTEMDWDSIIAETDQGFTGMTIDQARQQGLLDDLED